MHSENKKQKQKRKKKRKWGSATKDDDEEGEEYLKDVLINNVHDNDNDLIDERVGDQEDFQINISSARKHWYNYNIFVNTFTSCVYVLPGETAGDYISVVAPVGFVFVKNNSTGSGLRHSRTSPVKRLRTVRLLAG